MKNYSKVGNRRGRPAYRTPAGFRIRKALNIRALKQNRHARHSAQHPFQP